MISQPKKKPEQIDKKDRLDWLRTHCTAGRYLGTVEVERRRKRFVEYRLRLASIYSKLCYVCDKKADHYHHIVYLSRGGSNGPKNIVPMCATCHKKVHRHDPVRGNRRMALEKLKLLKVQAESPLRKPVLLMEYVPPKK